MTTGEAKEYKDLKQRWSKLVKRLEPFTKFKDNAGLADKLSTGLSKLEPTIEDVVAELKRLTSETADFSKALTERQRSGFKRVVAEWINHLKRNGQKLREGTNEWRIGSLHIELRPEASMARAHYNGEQVVDWTPIAEKADLDDLLEKANGKLENAEHDREELINTFYQAYQAAARAGKSERVPLPKLFTEFRLVLIRRELTSKPDRKVRDAEYPKWRFLYNCDKYRAFGDSIPAEKGLRFETGAQADAAKAGMRLNGLRADQEIKVLCYALPLQK
jgi:hypothetical protein